MPCHYDTSYEKKKTQDDLCDLTAMLCSACRVLERLEYDIEENPMLSRWWDQHKLDDWSNKNPSLQL